IEPGASSFRHPGILIYSQCSARSTANQKRQQESLLGKRSHRDARDGHGSPAGHQLPSAARERSRSTRLHLRADAQELHPHSRRGPGDRRALSLRPPSRPHHVSIQIAIRQSFAAPSTLPSFAAPPVTPPPPPAALAPPGGDRAGALALPLRARSARRAPRGQPPFPFPPPVRRRYRAAN